MPSRSDGGGAREVASSEEEAAVAAAMGPEGDLVALRLRRGCRCFAAWEGDAVAAYGWLSAGPEWIGEIGLEITPGPGEAYIWNCVTLPEHRLRGLFRGLVSVICAEARAEGMHRLWIASLRGSAENALVPLGFEPALRVTRDGDDLRVEVEDAALGRAGLRALGLPGTGHSGAGAPRRH